jgi:Xaa-Pro aminopeptidase
MNMAFDLRVYADRRKALMAKMNGGVAIVPSARMTNRNNDVDYVFRQDSDFYYLTGLDEPDCLLMLAPDSETPVTLFVRARDPEREAWDGPRAGVDGAMDIFGANAAFPIDEAPEKVRDALNNQSVLYYALGASSEWDRHTIDFLGHYRKMGRRGQCGPQMVGDPTQILHEMRLIKTDLEIDTMSRAALISCEAHKEAMRICKPGLSEAHLQSVLEYMFRMAGSQRQAYPPIVATGNNATILHYIVNDATVSDGDLVLIDAGCEYGYMASDITRSFPASGRFSKPQREIYQVVLDAQLAAIAHCRPGNSFESVHEVAVEVLTQGLISLNLIEGPVSEAIEEERYKPFYFHRTGHWLGMDVHDVGQYVVNGQDRILEPGMVLTVEPGIYVTNGHSIAPEHYHGIGVRIEDDVLVTEGEPRVLTAAAPKHIDEIEKLMTEDSRLPSSISVSS